MIDSTWCDGIWVAADNKSEPSTDYVRLVEGWAGQIPDAVRYAIGNRGHVMILVVRRLSEFYDLTWPDDVARNLIGSARDDRTADHCPAVYHDGLWKEADRRWRPAIIMAEEWCPTDRGGKTWLPYGIEGPMALFHEVGHALDYRGVRGRRLAFAPEFRAAYLEERRAIPAADRGVLDYFLGVWTVGVQETYADAFAALHTRLLPLPDGADLDPVFRAAFPRCMELVRRDVEALTADMAVAA